MMQHNFWNNKRVWVTGEHGFLGKQIVNHLALLGAQLVHLPHDTKRFDLRDERVVRAILETHSPNIVIHAAARVGGIGANQDRPAEFFYDNMMMGMQIIHQCEQFDVQKLVLIGTVCSYPRNCPTPFLEQNLWEGYPEETNAPYGIAKKALLVQARAYRDQYGLDYIYLIPTNLYGEGDNFSLASSHVIPAIIKKCIDGILYDEKEIVLWGDGSATREFLYVEDAARGIVRAAELYNEPYPINLGSSQEVTIYWLAREIARLTGYTGKLVWDSARPNGQPRRKVNTDKAYQEFGFVAATQLEQGLRKTIEWYKNKNNINLSTTMPMLVSSIAVEE